MVPRITENTTVEEAKTRPGGLDALTRFGINHCCGAHLPLREAAAAAGVPVDDVLKALAGAGERA
jgi:iron-sulfur cluster repair protein YtfE (RIC family)